MSALRICMLAAVGALVAVAQANAAAPSLRTMVLQYSDVQSGMAQTKNASVSAGQVKAQQGWVAPGFVGGWESDFSADSPIDGIVEVDSTAALYRTSVLAHGSVALGYKRMRIPSGWKDTRLPIGSPLGAEARMDALSGRSNGVAVTVYDIVWRSGRIKASVLIGGPTGQVHPVQAVALAKRQQALRIKP